MPGQRVARVPPDVRLSGLEGTPAEFLQLNSAPGHTSLRG